MTTVQLLVVSVLLLGVSLELVVGQGGVIFPPAPSNVKECKLLTSVPLCSEIYDFGSIPNIRDHMTQVEANTELTQFLPLIQTGCSNAIVHFLCSVYVPFCSQDRPGQDIKPCLELCEYVRQGCEQPLLDYGLNWPPHLECAQFPRNDTTLLDFCPNDLEVLELPQTVPLTTVIPPVTMMTAATSAPTSACPRSLRVMTTLENRSYSFGGIDNCGISCTGLYFTNLERNIIAPVFILLFAVICVFFTLFTVATFLIDRGRFHYPERPVVFISFCYLVVSVVYIVGAISKLAGQNNQAFSCTDAPSMKDVKTSSSFVFQRLPNSESTYKTASCVILFVVLYFFQMASGVWWMILTLTWFLAAALKWGEEAVERMWMLYHVLAWGIPAIQVILVLALQFVDGDQLSGLCYTGNASEVGLGIFVFLPLLVYLVVGVVFVAIGFTALVNIRKQLERDVAKAKKIGRLIMRVAIYSILYVVPNLVLLLLLVYELAQKSDWETAYVKDCTSADNNQEECHAGLQPTFAAFMLKYIMVFLVGIFSTSWIMTSKTFTAWHKLFCSCCATGSPMDVYGVSNQKLQHHYDVPERKPSNHQYVTGSSQHYDKPQFVISEKKDLAMQMNQPPHTAV